MTDAVLMLAFGLGFTYLLGRTWQSARGDVLAAAVYDLRRRLRSAEAEAEELRAKNARLRARSRHAAKQMRKLVETVAERIRAGEGPTS